MESLKRVIGEVLWRVSTGCTRHRKLLAPLGLRTNQSWFRGRTSSMRLPNDSLVRFSGVEQNYLSFELHWRDWTYFEPISMLLTRELLRGKQTFYDIGANTGYYALFAASEQPELAIEAFEPNPKLFRLLEENVRLNDAPIHCESEAISSRCGTQTFLLPKSDMSGTLEEDFHVLKREKKLDTVEVRTTTLDAYIEAHAPRGPMAIKIDVEGHEESLLRGAKDTLEQYHPDIIMEISFDHGPESESILREAGYRFYPIRRDGLREAEHLRFCKEGTTLYLNYLLTTAPPAQVETWFERIRPRVERLDLKRTTLYRPPNT